MTKQIWTATHKGWFTIFPVYLADVDSDICPLPRHVPDWTIDAAFAISQAVNWCLSWINPDAGGFMFWAVKELPKPITIEC